MPHDLNELLEFGPFRLDVREHQLLRSGTVLPLTSKAFDVLAVLVKNSGRTVTKDEFLSEVWAGTVVEEANLTDNISTLRQTLGDDAREPIYIQTVPRRGYKFIADVRPVGTGEPAVPRRPLRRWVTPIAGAAIAVAVVALAVRMLPRRDAAPDQAPHSLAVLPFKPLVAAQRDPALEVGMADALISKLTLIRSLSVRPTTAVLPYADGSHDLREIAAALDVDTLLDGKVQKSGDRVRVSVQLVRASDGSTLWGDRFDERFTDIFALQDAISERVASAFALRLTASDRRTLKRRSTENAEAYRLYLNGLYQWRTFSTDGLLAAVNYQTAAIRLDPNFALAWAGLAKAYNVIAIYGPIPAREAFPRSQEAAAKAVALDPDDPETHIPVVANKLFYERDWDGAWRELDVVERLDPDNGGLHTLRGYYYQAMGRSEDALRELEKARDEAPEWDIAKNDAMQALGEARRFDDAIREAREAIALEPTRAIPYSVLGDALAAKGDYASAIRAFENALARVHQFRTRILAMLGWAHARAGQAEEAREILQGLEHDPSPWAPLARAEIYTGLGDLDRTFAELNRAVDEHFAFVWDIRNRHQFDGIRNDPRYAQILKRLRLRA